MWLDPASFAEAVHAKGAPLQQCFGFIDGTVRESTPYTIGRQSV